MENLNRWENPNDKTHECRKSVRNSKDSKHGVIENPPLK